MKIMEMTERPGGRIVSCADLDYDDPLAALMACHRKIEDQLERMAEAAREIVEAGPAALPAAIARLVGAKARFGGPRDRHTQDEELSLFPRLLGAPRRVDTRVVRAVERLRDEHRVAEARHGEFRDLVAAVRLGAPVRLADARRLVACVSSLSALYLAHIELEEEVVYREAARVLSTGELAAVGDEMRARRAR